MATVDIIVLLILAVSTVLGGFRGVVREAISLVGWIVGVWLAYRYHGSAGQWLAGFNVHDALSNPAVQKAAGFLLVLIIAVGVISIVGWLIGRLLLLTGLTLIDRVLGLAFGFARGLLVIVVLTSLVESTPIAQTGLWKDSKLVRPLKVVSLALGERLSEAVPDLP